MPKLMEDVEPRHLPTPEGVLAVWVIYDHPADYPHHFVLRPQYATPGGKIDVSLLAWVADDIEQLREAMREMGLTCLPRRERDDPKIVETWM